MVRNKLAMQLTLPVLYCNDNPIKAAAREAVNRHQWHYIKSTQEAYHFAQKPGGKQVAHAVPTRVRKNFCRQHSSRDTEGRLVSAYCLSYA